jgi:tRNA(fMet)-specific endonuclease VapC
VKKILIDTNIYSYVMRGDPEAVGVLQQAQEIGICSISIGELLSGFKGGKRERKNWKELEEFLDVPRVIIYRIDENTAEFYADILNNLKKRGKPIPTNDIWIAAVALQHGFRLFSMDRHFAVVAGLLLVH